MKLKKTSTQIRTCFLISRDAENRTQPTCSQSMYTTNILHPGDPWEN